MTTDKIKNWIIIALFGIVGILLFLSQCSTKKVVTTSKPEITEHTVYQIKVFRDTIFKHDTITKHIIVYNKSNLDGVVVEQHNDTTLITRELADSNMTAVFKTKLKGDLIDQTFDYKLKIPTKIIIRIDSTITKTDSVFIRSKEQSKFGLYVGGLVGGNATQFNFGPYLQIAYKRVSYMYDYDLINKTHNIGIGFKLFSK
jgi:hypothetical protein